MGTVLNPQPMSGWRPRPGAGCEDGAVSKGVIVVCDDEANIAELVELYLDREGFRVYTAGTGERALELINEHRPNLVVMDVGLPGMSGLDVCRTLRKTSDVPVIFLTARDGEIDRILGLELGADDYVTKPFSPGELTARVKAVLRRSEGTVSVDDQAIVVGDVVINPARREIKVRDEVVEFTTKEFDLLQYLAERPGLALSRQQILDGVWGYDWYGDARTVDVHMAQVRKKVGDALTITTVRGIGYRLEPS